jgi:hypothetical protein
MTDYIVKDISFARYIGLFAKGVSGRLLLLHVYRTPRNIMAERASTGQAVGSMTADLVGPDRVRRHPHHRA